MILSCMPTPPMNHLAVIMDGNRRWAQQRGLSANEGHLAGYERLKQIGDACIDRGIPVFTVFAFSTENWKRNQEEVGFLMDLMERALTRELEQFTKRGARLRIVGRREGLRPSVLRAIEHAEESSKANTASTFVICFNYGGQAEIVDACKKIVADGIAVDQVNELEIQKRMYWPEMPAPDVIVRTSGEERTSGFLTWEAAYSELYWTKKDWPDFDEQELDAVIQEYARRQRRFGA